VARRLARERDFAEHHAPRRAPRHRGRPEREMSTCFDRGSVNSGGSRTEPRSSTGDSRMATVRASRRSRPSCWQRDPTSSSHRSTTWRSRLQQRRRRCPSCSWWESIRSRTASSNRSLSPRPQRHRLQRRRPRARHEGAVAPQGSDSRTEAGRCPGLESRSLQGRVSGGSAPPARPRARALRADPSGRHRRCVPSVRQGWCGRRRGLRRHPVDLRSARSTRRACPAIPLADARHVRTGRCRRVAVLRTERP